MKCDEYGILKEDEAAIVTIDGNKFSNVINMAKLAKMDETFNCELFKYRIIPDFIFEFEMMAGSGSDSCFR